MNAGTALLQTAGLTQRFRGGLQMRGADGIDMFSGICRFEAEQPSRFSASMGSTDFGAVRVNRMKSTAVTGVRPPAMLDDEMGDYVAVASVRSGTVGLEQQGISAQCSAGDISFVDFGREFRLDVAAGSECVFVYLPRQLLAERSIDARKLTGAVISGSPVGAALVGMLEPLTGHHPNTLAEQSLVERAIADLALAVIAQPADEAPAPEEMAVGNRARVYDFIERHFTDPTLNVDRVAAGINVSSRYLHKLMEGDGISVYGMIRRRRVRHGIDLLADPRVAHLSVGQIARRSGFTGLSQFGRAVRDMAGESPRQIRQRAMALV
ncbi:helix-turn-helix domain-containing protein [Rhodococcus sp. NPDC058514]|uniref:AraC-like ligand-binding domain-containing protein n=1 Tax=unclassified Rhodococcus (in: high G+C Gram-positive bacteria) TaxID=192944 RepID=UPI00364CC420